MKKQHSYASKKVYSMAEMDIPKDKVEQLQDLFHKRKDSNEFISIYNAIVVMKEMGFSINEEKKLDIVKYVKYDFLRFDHLRRLFNYLNSSDKLVKSVDDCNLDYSDAFIAVGGDEELSGTINIEDVKQIFQKFNLEMSINSLLQKNNLDDETDIDFDQFCKLFSDSSIEKSKSLFNLVAVKYAF